MMHHDPLWRNVVIFIIVAMVGILWLGHALSQELPPSMHHAEDPDHWYDYSCCSLKDCAPARAKVSEGPDGYVVTQLGEVIPYNHKKVRQSKDGEFHICERKAEYEGSRIICLYVPPRAF